jgi:ribosome biogenesis GTPase / thiamine phosphate phosphatase
LKGTVIKSTGSWYTIKSNEGETVMCRLQGKHRLLEVKTTNPIAVGDIVQFELEPNQQTGTITKIEQRKNYIIRPDPHKKAFHQIIASNLDQVVIVTALKQPRVPLGFIDRLSVIAEAYHIPVIILFNKADIYADDEIEKFIEAKSIYEALGYTVLLISSQANKIYADKKNTLADKAIHELLKDKNTLFSGHSGVGKTALLNLLSPDLKLKTHQVSEYNEKGQHTTTFAEMYALNDTTNVIDTPGVKEFGLLSLELKEVWQYFPEMKALASQCKFNNCIHIDEPECAVKHAFEAGEIHPLRFNSYFSIIEEIKYGLKFWERK